MFEYKVFEETNQVRILFQGVIDNRRVLKFKGVLSDLLSYKRTEIILDFSKVYFISSEAAGQVAMFFKRKKAVSPYSKINIEGLDGMFFPNQVDYNNFHSSKM